MGMSDKRPASTSVSPWRIFIYVLIVMAAIQVPVVLQLPLWVGLALAPLAAGITWWLVIGRRRA